MDVIKYLSDLVKENKVTIFYDRDLKMTKDNFIPLVPAPRLLSKRVKQIIKEYNEKHKSIIEKAAFAPETDPSGIIKNLHANPDKNTEQKVQD